MKKVLLILFVFVCSLQAFAQSPVVDTTHLGLSSGTGIASHVTFCQTVLPASGGTCDASAEPAQTTSATITVSSNNVALIMPPVTITLGSGFIISVTGNYDKVICPVHWSCFIDASTNGTSAFSLVGTNTIGDVVTGFHIKGGRLNGNAGTEVAMTGTNHQFIDNWVEQAGGTAISPGACNACVVQFNTVDQAGAAAILVAATTNGVTSNYNDIGFNLVRDSNTTSTTQGQIGAVCSATNCSNTPSHAADFNNFHDNIAINQALGSGDCNSRLALTSAANAAGGNTVYTGFISNGAANALVGVSFVVTGFTTGANNGTFTATASTSTTLTLNNAGGVSEAPANPALAATVTPTTTDTGCSETFQTTDSAWYTTFQNNKAFNSSKEGYVWGGIGARITGNLCDGCGQHTATPGGAFQSSFLSTVASPQTRGDFVLANNVVTNTTAATLLYGFSLQSTNSVNWTLQDVIVANNVVDSGQASGTVNTQNAASGSCASNAVSWVSGNQFNTTWTSITINGTTYTVSSVPSSTLLCLSSAPGTQTAVGYVGTGGTITNGLRIRNTGGGTVTLNNVRFIGNQTGTNITNRLSLNYAGYTGAVRLEGNGFNASTDATPVTANVAAFDSNGQPELDSGTSLVAMPSNACRLTTDISISTATTICTWSLPAIAKSWAWQCQIPWAVTAGTTPTLAMGVNASQTPTATTNATAEIKTTLTNTATEKTVGLSASGAVPILTSPTLAASANVFNASTSGTLAASATAGTFTITMTGTGTGFTGAAKAGTTCLLY